MRKISKYSVCFFVALFLLSCSNDELETNQETVKDVKSKLELAKFSNPNIAQNVEADFENANEIEKDNFKISEFSAKEKVVNYFESDLLQNQLKYQGVTIENDGKTHSYFLEVYTFKKSATYPESITKFKDFSGGLNVYSFEGENLGSVGVINGKAKNISGKEELDILTEAINLFYVSSDITEKIPLCDGTYTQVVEQIQDRWRIVSLGPKILSVEYMGVKVTRTTTILPYPCDGSGDRDAIILQRTAHYYTSDGKSYAGVSGLLDTIITDSSFLNNPCLFSVFEKLGGSPTFQTYLKKFDSEFSVANLKLTAGNVGMEGSYGKTLMPQNSEVVIIMNDRELDRPALDIAKTLMHEMIHAEIFRQLLSMAKTNGAIDVNEISRLAQLPNDNQVLEYYWKYRNGKQDAAHELMSAKYLDVMVSFLKEVDKSLTQKQYEAIAWQGLTGTSVWNEMDPNKKADLQNTYDKWRKESSHNCN
ncbi:MAG: hypothetical protein ACN6OI_16715 [Flavobacterium sp.]|uniref:hypothetical protein n=1 Tax=Flavobacterium sp. TaxID=239 RepID=UPI003D1127E0